MDADPLCEWAYTWDGKEYLIVVMPDGKCLCFDEEMRRRAQRGLENGRVYLLREIKADRPSIEQAQKREFSVSFEIGENLLELIRSARAEFDQTDTVSASLGQKINSGFDSLFPTAILPFL